MVSPASAPETTEAINSVCDPRGALNGLAAQTRQVLGGLDPDAVLARHAPGLWDTCDEIARLAGGAKTLLARRVADSGVFKDSGHRDTAEYLAAHSGASRPAMANLLATSNRLPSLPATEAAVRSGELSADQAVAVADGAHVHPQKEQELLTAAKHLSLKELRDAAVRAKAEADPDPEATRKRQHDERHFGSRTGADGRWLFSGSGTPEDRARFEAALAPHLEAAFQKARAEGRHEPRTAHVYDALQEMANQAHDSYHDGSDQPAPDAPAAENDNRCHDDHGNDDGGGNKDRNDDGGGNENSGLDGGNPGPRPTPTAPSTGTSNPVPSGDDPLAATGEPIPASNPANDDTPADNINPGPPAKSTAKRGRRPNLSLLPILRLDLTALHRGYLLAGEACEITGNGPITLTAASELITDSVVKLVLTRGHHVHTVAHIGRAPPRPRHMALLHTDLTDLTASPTTPGEPSCAIPGTGTVRVAATSAVLGHLGGIDLLDQAIKRGVDVNLTHLGRQPTIAQKVALLWSQPGCSVVGCPHTFTQIDHRTEWRKQNLTDLMNLDRLCVHHHRLKTTQNYQLVPGTGDRAFVPPTDSRHPDHNNRPGQTPPHAA